jgi:L-fuculose-phosphate aldolase
MLEILKKEVCDIAKRAQRDGLCKHKSGNFSARDKETGYVVITPTSVDRELLTPRDMVVMDLDANVIENLSGLRPTSESLMHLMIYKTREDVLAVAHTHSVFATSFAVLKKPIPAIVYEVAGMGLTKGRVPVAPYGRPGTPALAESVVDAVKEADAFLKAAYVEELAELYHRTLTANGGKEPDSFPQEELQQWEYPKEIKFANK